MRIADCGLRIAELPICRFADLRFAICRFADLPICRFADLLIGGNH